MIKKILLMSAVLLTMVLNSAQAQLDSCYLWVTQNSETSLIAHTDTALVADISWSNGQTGFEIYVTQTGTYCATLTTIDSCVMTDCFEYFADGNPLDTLCWTYISLDSTETCLIANGNGQAPYQYDWSNGQVGQVICPPNDQDFCVTITDFNGCQSTACNQITSTCTADIVLDTLVNELGLTGIASGAPPFTYSWSTGETTQTISLDSSYYCLTITDSNGCWSTDCWNAPSSCTYDFFQTESGDLCVSNFNGEGPFQVQWSTGDSSNCISITQSGYYDVTITNNTGCYLNTGGWFTPPINDTLCHVNIYSDWSGDLFVSHNSSYLPPFTYEWSNGETGNTIFPTDTVEYCVTVTNDVGCVAIACWDSLSLITYICQAEILEIGNNNLCIQTTGGTTPYTYSWNTGDSSDCIFINEYSYYNATVTDAAGCTSIVGGWYGSETVDTNCYVLVFNNFFNCISVYPQSGGVWPYTYLWDDGSTSNAICDIEVGTYCVTLTDATGCESYGCTTVDQDCQASIERDTLDNGQITLTLIPENADLDSLSLYWTYGETTQTIVPEYNGVYCVNIQSSNCWDQICDTIVGVGCSVSIIDTIDILSAQVFGLYPYTYQWSNGSTLSYLENPAPGNYCLTVTDATGCMSEACGEYDPNIYFIEGWVNIPNCEGVDSMYIDTGFVQLYKFDVDGMPQLHAESVFSYWNSYYHFADLEEGNYLVRTFIDPFSPNGDNYLPTYYESSLLWNEAQMIAIPYTEIFTYYDIDMQCAEIPPGGDGYIGGFIDDGEHNDDLDPEAGGPQEDVSIFLYDENGNALMYTMSNSTGAFFFDDLPWGTYEVVIEIPGRDQGRFWVTIDFNNRSVTLNINTNDNGMITDVADLNNKIDLKVFPNPTNGLVNVQVSTTELSDALLQLVDIHGKLIFSKNLNSGQQNALIPVDLTGMSSGMYFIKISDNNTFYTKKVILQ